MFVAVRWAPATRTTPMPWCWDPAGPDNAFMRDIGAALSPGNPPDPDHMREVYARYASRLLP